MNIIRFLIQCCLFFGIQSFIMLTMYYSHMADVNVGIITTLWSVQPLAAALLDYLIYGERLTKYHLIGMITVIISALMISFSKYADPAVSISTPEVSIKIVIYDPRFPKWVAVLFGILTPCFFVTSALFIKHLTSKEVGFDAMTVSFATSSATSVLIIIIGAAWFWQEVETFNKRLFIIGFFGSILDTCGKACIQRAYSKGPAGPVAAIVECNNVLLILFEAIRTKRVPNYLEFLGFLCAILGALIMSIPDEINQCLRCFFCCKVKNKD